MADKGSCENLFFISQEVNGVLLRFWRSVSLLFLFDASVQ